MSSILTIDGVDYDQSDRKASSLIVDGWAAWDLGGDQWLEFHEYAAGYRPRFLGPKSVRFTDAGGVLRFTGEVTGVQPGWSDEGRTWGYRCAGLKYICNQFPVTGIDGSGLLQYNLRLTDEDYLQSMAGKSIGYILKAVLELHSAQLAACGVSTDATTDAQLATMTLVPQDPVHIQGERFIQALENLLRTHAPYARLVITPAGLIRFVDTSAGTSHTLTLGSDPVAPPLFSREWANCATRLVNRGRGKIAPAYVSQLQTTVQKAWTGPQEAAWKWADFTQPGDATDRGAVTTTGGPTSITIQSSNGARTWGTNFWNDRQSWIYLTKTTGTGLTYQEARPVVACSSLTAGGTATLTLGYPLDNSASDSWDKYELVGKVAQLGDDGLNNVWRLYNIVTPGNWIEQHLVKSFPVPVPFIGLNNASAEMVSSPVCHIVYQGTSFPATFRVLPGTGQILFDRPVVETINNIPSVLEAGGVGVNKPDDLIVLLAYSRGALEAPYPADASGVPQYAGTAHAAGLERTYTADIDSWVYEGNYAQMEALAETVHRSICDTVIEGSIRYKGLYEDVLDVGVGHRMCIAATCGTTGDESLNVPVRSVEVRHHWQGGGLLVETNMAVSSRRDPRTSAGFYMHLSQLGSGGGMGGGSLSMGGGFMFAGGRMGTGDSGDDSGLGGFGGAGGGRNTYQRRKPKQLGNESRVEREARIYAANSWKEDQSDRDARYNANDAKTREAQRQKNEQGTRAASASLNRAKGGDKAFNESQKAQRQAQQQKNEQGSSQARERLARTRGEDAQDVRDRGNLAAMQSDMGMPSEAAQAVHDKSAAAEAQRARHAEAVRKRGREKGVDRDLDAARRRNPLIMGGDPTDEGLA